MPSRALLSTTQNPDSFLHSKLLLLLITSTAAFLFLVACIFFLFYLYHTLIINRSKTNPFDSSNTQLLLQVFSYRQLKSATNSFHESNCIGKGGSGTVYRGVLRDGKSIAVKKLDSSSSSDREFQNELQILGGLRRSQFVVSLLGYCVEKKTKRFLVYEFMPNKSLQESLFNEEISCLDWEKRFEIILDVTRALSFLHLECDPPVIHGDVKPSNVLLGFDYRAKISDFGLSRTKIEEEGEFLFSQDLIGPSEELHQDFSSNQEAKIIGNQVNSTEVVDFSLALQAAASCSKNTADCNFAVVKTSSSSMNLNDEDEDEDQKRCKNGKGKEICRNDDDDNVVPDHEEEMICSSFGHSKELNFVDDSMQWGQDWWWRQDGSGELCSKDYVKEWIGSQICPSTNPDWDDDEEDEKGDDKKSTQQLGKSGGRSSSKPESKKKPSGEKSMNKKQQRKMQEWWKEENLAEVSNNGHSTSKLKKIECKVKKGLRIQSARSFLFRKKKRIKCSQNESNPDRDFSFRRKKHSHSHSGAASDMWSGDVYSRELSSTTSMRGTVCYVAPEYGGGGGGGGGGYLMEKADIYSLGVLILVIVSGRRPLHVLNSPMKLEKANLIHWCRQLAKGGGNVLELVDEKLKGAYNKEQASLCINLALMCLKKMPELRPDICEIVKILKGEMDLQGVPFEFSPSPPSKYYSRSRRRAKTDE